MGCATTGDFIAAVHDKIAAEHLTRVLYPDDHTERGRILRFVQESANAFSQSEPSVFAPIWDMLLTHGDYYMYLADLSAYVQAQERIGALYRQPDAWARQAILNLGHAGRFSSDYTIAAYAADIWQARPCPVE